MEDIEIQQLYDNYHRKIAKISLDFKRYLYSKINWNARMIGIKGARGVGKTTLLLQHILDNYKDLDQTLYVSLDDLWFTTHKLMDLVDWADRHGITRLYLDEVHRYREWSETLKNIYDSYPDMGIVYTSSSLLAMDNAKVDLSRRQTLYMLYGMSFREYLAFENAVDISPLSMDELLHDHVRYAMQMMKDIKIAPVFESYLDHGYYPFYREAGDGYLERLGRMVDQVLEVDLPAVENVTVSTVRKIRKMLMILAAKCPQTPKMKDLYAELETDRVKGLTMLQCLGRAGLMSLLSAEASSLKYLSRPDKIYCDNTNLMQALVSAVDTGTSRETFFLNQLKSAGHVVTLPEKGDFKVDDTWLFEVGGEGKGFNQIKDIKDSFVANDDTEIGIGNKIPLWLFGFLY